MSRSSPEALVAGDTPPADEIIVSILRDVGDMPRLMEFYYLWREPNLFEAVRFLSLAPATDLARLARFFRHAPDRAALRIEFPDVSCAVLRLT
jgi:hypothetical protein